MSISEQQKSLVTISILGRPNVGKSTLFNRLIGKQDQAMTYDRPGVTRDRHFDWIPLQNWPGRLQEHSSWLLVDTGGFYPEADASNFHFWQIEASLSEKEKLKQQDLFSRMEQHIVTSIEESDLLLIVVDAREGCLPHDRRLIEIIRKENRPFLVVANKVDGPKQELILNEFYSLGLDEHQLVGVSAAHGRFLEELQWKMIELVKTLPEKNQESLTLKSLQPKGKVVGTISLVGAPNAGKSTLLNQLLGEERSLVSPIPGTTLDPVTGYVDLYIGEKASLTERTTHVSKEEYQTLLEKFAEEEDHQEEVQNQESASEMSEETNHWRSLKIIDTAGIRRKPQIHDDVESLSVYRSLKNIDQSDIVIYMIDAFKGPSHQDARLCEIILEKGKALILCFNKMDLVEAEWKGEDYQKKKKRWWEEVRWKLSWLHYCNFLPLSAKHGTSIQRLKQELRKTLIPLAQEISTGVLNRTLSDLFDKKSIPLKLTKGKMFKLKYASQVKTNPPTFILFTNYQQHIPDSYRRYLVNGLREKFGYKNVPIHLIFRAQSKTRSSDDLLA